MSQLNEEPAVRKPRGIAIGFLCAFVLTTITIIWTGLLVKAPRSSDRNAENSVDASAEAVPQPQATDPEYQLPGDAADTPGSQAPQPAAED